MEADETLEAPADLSTEALARRNRYLQAGLRCIKRLGLNETTMDDIAAEAGVKRITLYRQFGSRKDLIRLIVKIRFDSFNRRFAARVSLTGDLPTVLEEYLMAGLAEALRDPLTRDTIQGQLDFASPGEPLHASARVFWEPLISAAQRKGKLDPALSVEATVQWILVTQFTLCRLELDSRMDSAQARQLIRSFILPAFTVRKRK